MIIYDDTICSFELKLIFIFPYNFQIILFVICHNIYLLLYHKVLITSAFFHLKYTRIINYYEGKISFDIRF